MLKHQLFHGNNFVFVTESNVYFPMSFNVVCACIVNLFFFLDGIAQYGSNVPFYSFPTAILFLSLLYIFLTTFRVFFNY